MTNRDDREMRMRDDRYGMRGGMNDRNDDRYGRRDDFNRDRDQDFSRYGANRESSGYGMNDRDRYGTEGGYTGGLGYRDSLDRNGRSGRDAGGMGEPRRDDQGSYGDRYGLGYGAGDRAGGYGDQFGGLRYDGRATGGMGDPAAGQHYGRGPKNYQRSADRIREDVNEQLTYHHDLDASDIEVQVQNGEVTLTGTVEDRRAKRLAEDAAEQVRGVRDVHNQLKVKHGGLLGAIGNMLGGNDNQNNR